VATGLQLALVQAAPQARLRNAGLLAGLLVWMLYTRYFATAQALHATLPPCPFLLVTGHPCPFCGGTRSFASMWHGDLGRAAALYPLGPVLFCAALAAIPVLGVALILGRDLRWTLSRSWVRAIAVAACLPLAASWALKLTVLPN
jgi:Protein of unknown function (DUF2752)